MFKVQSCFWFKVRTSLRLLCAFAALRFNAFGLFHSTHYIKYKSAPRFQPAPASGLSDFWTFI